MYKIIGSDGKEYGPVSADQLRQWIAEGRVNAQTRICLDGTTDWKPLSEFPELMGAAAPGAAPGAVPGPLPTQPQPYSFPTQGAPSGNAAEMVNGPAIGLIITGALALLGNIAGLLMNLFGASLMTMSGAPSEAWAGMMQGSIGIISSVLGMITSGLVIYGALKMKQLESYTWAMASSIIAMIPCFVGLCCLIGLPVGIWSLIVLAKPEVKSSFRS